MHRTLIILAASVFSAPAFAQDEADISMEEVPAAVLETAIDTAPGVEFERISVEVENGVEVYEFEAYDFAGRHIEVDVLADGTLSEIEMEISLDDLPSDIAAAMEAAAPGFAPDYIELSVRNGSEIVYEFEGSYDNQEIDMEIAENGELISLTSDAVS